jgi:biotin transport system substrate-specific component
MSRLAAPTVFVDAFAADPSSRGGTIAIRAAAVLLMTGLIAAAAQVSFSIPFTTIPFTMQPMLVLMTGMALGARLGTSAQVLYLAAGIAGLPVFAASATLPMGAARLLGPTGGYLLAYPVAAFVCGWLAERGLDRRYSTSVVAMLVGLAVIYAGGVSWLAALSGVVPGQASAGWSYGLAAGFYPFVLADVGKVLVAGAILPAAWRLFR